MTIKITKVEQQKDCYVLWYHNPVMPDLDHNHYIPFDAVEQRMTFYGVTAEDAIEEIIHEHWSPTRDPDKWATRDDRMASKKANGPVVGHKGKIRTDHVPLDADKVRENMLAVMGVEHFDQVRGKGAT